MTDTLLSVDTTVGGGARAATGSRVTIHSLGRLENGYTFDDTRSSGAPHRFRLGDGEVIEGWEQGIVGMRVGGVRQLTVPAALAYGERGVLGRIPPNATLLFDVQLIALDPPEAAKPVATEWL